MMSTKSKNELYRATKSRKEIIAILESSTRPETLFTVWQNTIGNSRLLLNKISNFKMLGEEGIFTVEMEEKDFKSLDKNGDVFFLIEGEGLIFKTKKSVDQSKGIAFKIPFELRVIEKRQDTRTIFSPDEQKIANVTFMRKDSSALLPTICPLLNISEGGASLILSKESLSIIDIKEKIIFRFEKTHKKAEIRNVRIHQKKDLKHDEIYAIGIMFLSDQE